MKGKKGLTLMEVIVSLVLISVVLIFLMVLFVRVRGNYKFSKLRVDYEVAVGNIIRAVGNDIENYGLLRAECETTRCDALVMTYDDFRSTKLNERIKKVLRIEYKNNLYSISYAYEKKYTSEIQDEEKFTKVYVTLPESAILNNPRYIVLKEVQDVLKIQIPLSDKNGNCFDINIYGVYAR